MTVERNLYLSKLENRAVQDKIFDTLRTKNPFFVFEKAGQVEMYSDRAIFIGTQPAAGEDYTRVITPAQEPLVFSHELGIVLKRRYSTVTNRDIEKMAIETPEKLAELLAQIVKDIINRAHYELLMICVEKLCTDDNYRKVNEEAGIAAALVARPVEDFKKPAQVLRWINNARAFMCSPSTSFNKGFRDPAVTNSEAADAWVSILACSYDPSELVLITDPSVYNMLEEEIFSQGFHYNLKQLEEKFGLVIQTPLSWDRKDESKKSYQMIVMDKSAFALRYVIKKGIESKYNPENLQTSFFLHNWLIVGSIPFANQTAWKLA